MTPRWPPRRLTLLPALVLLGAAGLAGVGAGAAPARQAGAPTCAIDTRKDAAPAEVRLGDSVALTLTVRATCKPAVPDPQDVRLGLVRFADGAETLCELTDDTRALASCVGALGAGGGTRIDDGVREALEVLARGRAAAPGVDVAEVLVVISGSGNDAGCQPVLQAASVAKARGVLVVTVCVGSGCDRSCMRPAASSPRYFFTAEDSAGLLEKLVAVFDRLRDQRQVRRNLVFAVDGSGDMKGRPIADVRTALAELVARSGGSLVFALRELTVTDRLPPNMRYVEGSARPAPEAVEAGGLIRWHSLLIRDVATYTLAVRPLETGLHPTNLDAFAEAWEFQSAAPSTLLFPVPRVNVRPSNPTGQPSTTAPTGPPTPEPETPTPSPPATPRLQALHLPILWSTRVSTAVVGGHFGELAEASSGACTVAASHDASPAEIILGESITSTLHVVPSCSDVNVPLDLALVLDASASMAGDNARRLKESAEAFVDRLQLAGHPERFVGIVEFASVATKLCDLTNDPGRVLECIGRVGSSGDRWITAGVREGLKVLLRGRRSVDSPRRRRLIVVFASGPDDLGCPALRQAADSAKAQGIEVATVCLAPDCDAACMRIVATTAPGAVDVPDLAGLRPAFASLADTLVSFGAVAFRWIEVVDLLPADMGLVPGSISPPPHELDEATRRVTWQTIFAPAGGMTYTLHLVPTRIGLLEASAGARGAYVDGAGEGGNIVFPVPRVDVRPAIEPRTPAPTPTPGAGAETAEPPGTATPPPSPTDTPRPRTAYVPVASRGLDAPAPVRGRRDGVSDLRQGAPRPCTLSGTHDVAPAEIALGEEVTVTLRVSGSCSPAAVAASAAPGAPSALCPPGDSLLRLVLVLDASGSMAGDPTARMKAAASQLVRGLQLEENPGTTVGVVQFNSSASRLCELTNDTARLLGCIRRVGANGGTNIDAGMTEGLAVMQRGRAGIPPVPARELLFVLTDGDNNAGCPPLLAAADRTKAAGVEIGTLCLGPNCDAPCMRQVASGPASTWHAAAPADLLVAFQVVQRWIEDTSDVVLRSVQVVDLVPKNLGLLAHTIAPAASLDAAAGRITWCERMIPMSGLTLTFRARPQRVGLWPVSLGATAEYRDILGFAGQLALPVPHVDVRLVAASPTPRAGTPAASSTPGVGTPATSPTPRTGTPAGSPMPSATAQTPRPTEDLRARGAIYLPRVWRESSLSLP